MASVTEEAVGAVVAIWRYPVKSMRGEELNATELGERGVVGDRVYAIVDPDSGKVASAKNPKKWPRLFDCGVSFVHAPQPGGEIPPVRVMLPDGSVVFSDDDGFGAALTSMLGRPGVLKAAVPEKPVLEEYWPDIEGLSIRDDTTDEDMPLGTFFDCAPVHLLTTGTLDSLRGLHPPGRFEIRRFRPNIVIDTGPDAGPFPESDWVDRIVAIGDQVKLKVTGPCPRCVMTTLPQSDLPRDPGILRAAAQHHDAHVGIYAEVVQSGTTRRGDTVRVE